MATSNIKSKLINIINGMEHDPELCILIGADPDGIPRNGDVKIVCNGDVMGMVESFKLKLDSKSILPVIELRTHKFPLPKMGECIG